MYVCMCVYTYVSVGILAPFCRLVPARARTTGGSNAMDDERRIARNGQVYTRLEFDDYYGAESSARWEEATIANAGAAQPGDGAASGSAFPTTTGPQPPLAQPAPTVPGAAQPGSRRLAADLLRVAAVKDVALVVDPHVGRHLRLFERLVCIKGT